jgi:type III secretory pathway component EscV
MNRKAGLKELAMAAIILATLASMLLPLPGSLMDLLLVGNLVIALVLLITAMYISEPLKLSALPSMLLLATLFRLALNISTTRLILGSADAGRVIPAFGATVVQGNLTVGLIVFLVISLVQFIVIAKGAERVAEVAARFTLDALPGRQMSIDADVRAGLIDFEEARDRRKELQLESRFYGALDGAMKFVKGDAIAGLAIIAVNLIGGFLVGVLIHNLDLAGAISRYSLLSIGDGLLSQIPSLLNSLAAGMVVTRVCRGDGSSLAEELISQLGQMPQARLVVGSLLLVFGVFSGFPLVPFAAISGALLVSVLLKKPIKCDTTVDVQKFSAQVPRLLTVELDSESERIIRMDSTLEAQLEKFRSEIFAKFGLIVLVPELKVNSELSNSLTVRIRGNSVMQALHSTIRLRTTEFVDDIMTRRLLDSFDRESPELVSAVVPGVVTLTQLTDILRSLVRDGLALTNFDMILQAVADAGISGVNGRGVLEEVRVGLAPLITAHCLNKFGKIGGITLDPVLDLSISRAERENTVPNPEMVSLMVGQVRDILQQTAPELSPVIVTSRASRRLTREYLTRFGLRLSVIAYEEILHGTSFESLGAVSLASKSIEDELIERLAA